MRGILVVSCQSGRWLGTPCHDVTLPAHHQAAKISQPGKCPLYPASAAISDAGDVDRSIRSMPCLFKRCRSPFASQAFLYMRRLGRLRGRPRPLPDTAKVANAGSITGTAARDIPSSGGFPEKHRSRQPPFPAWFSRHKPPFFRGVTRPSRTLQTNRAGPRACYAFESINATKRLSIRIAKATKCNPASVSANRS